MGLDWQPIFVTAHPALTTTNGGRGNADAEVEEIATGDVNVSVPMSSASSFRAQFTLTRLVEEISQGDPQNLNPRLREEIERLASLPKGNPKAIYLTADDRTAINWILGRALTKETLKELESILAKARAKALYYKLAEELKETLIKFCTTIKDPSATEILRQAHRNRKSPTKLIQLFQELLGGRLLETIPGSSVRDGIYNFKETLSTPTFKLRPFDANIKPTDLNSADTINAKMKEMFRYIREDLAPALGRYNTIVKVDSVGSGTVADVMERFNEIGRGIDNL